ncbi:MAG: addiction module toxin RelE [Spirulina sp. SIO3F2]|nr:addiction module toxin RelE [Spirulina sp. SIO3F2]
MGEWTVEFDDDFAGEFRSFAEEVQTEIAARAELLAQFGPMLGRPFVDTLNGSKHANMKELRLTINDGVWRVAFAFDPDRKAILLVAGDKSGVPQRRFYRKLIQIADKRFDKHLKQLGGN